MWLRCWCQAPPRSVDLHDWLNWVRRSPMCGGNFRFYGDWQYFTAALSGFWNSESADGTAETSGSLWHDMTFAETAAAGWSVAKSGRHHVRLLTEAVTDVRPPSPRRR